MLLLMINIFLAYEYFYCKYLYQTKGQNQKAQLVDINKDLLGLEAFLLDQFNKTINKSTSNT